MKKIVLYLATFGVFVNFASSNQDSAVATGNTVPPDFERFEGKGNLTYYYRK